VRTGAPVGATLILSASIRADGEARWVERRRRKPAHGYNTIGQGGGCRGSMRQADPDRAK
jgi:hypothetical protein